MDEEAADLERMSRQLTITKTMGFVMWLAWMFGISAAWTAGVGIWKAWWWPVYLGMKLSAWTFAP